MGTKLNRIEQEFVLNSVIDGNTPFRLHRKQRNLEAFLKSYDDKIMSFKMISEETPEKGEEIRFYFFFQNNMHSFDSRVSAVEGNSIHVILPSGIYKALQRKHERIRSPRGISASFLLKGKSIELDFPKTDSYAVVEKPQVSMKFEESSIAKMIAEFRRRMQSMISSSEIVIFRDREPAGFEEALLFKTAKVLWIPSTRDTFPVDDPFPDGRIITKEQLDEIVVQGDDEQIISSANIDDLLEKKLANGILSEIFSPMLYHQYLVGYIHLANDTEKSEKLGVGMVEYAYQFAKVLCYSLEINNYFKPSKVSERRYDAGIIDISASGLLFTHPAKELTRDLLVHTDIALNLQLGDRSMAVGSRVIRKFSDRDHLYIALQFLDIKPEDFRLLYETIYGERLDEAAEDHWEGGIPPPELRLD